MSTPGHRVCPPFSLKAIVRWLAGCPLLIKLLVPNSLMVVLGLLLGYWLLGSVLSPQGAARWPAALLLGTGIAGAMLLANYLILRAALQPVRALREVAQALARGDPSVTLPRPFFSDPTVDRLLEAVDQALTELGAYRRRLQDLSSRVSTQLETERQNLARELHDDVAQNLASLLVLEGLMAQAEAPEERRRLVEQAREITRAALESVRRLSQGLHPRVLDDTGLPGAIHWYVEEVMGTVLPPVTLDIDPDLGRLPRPAELALFRIAQEALGNVARHARARSVRLALHRSGPWAVLRVEDDGVGFDPGRQPQGGNHLGLFSMQERARIVGGTLEVFSRPGEGTTIVARVPVAPAEDGPGVPEGGPRAAGG